MVIDVHTHVFPDAIADRTIAALQEKSRSKANTDGKLSGLLDSMRESDVDCSVVAPVVTAPRQFDSINRFAYKINKDYGDDKINGVPRLLSFGGIHPDSEDYKGQLNELKAMGFKGIKLHPDYQGVFFDDIRCKRIVSYATELGMHILVHAGVDIGLPEPVHCTPKMTDEVVRETESDKLIMAHLGGYKMWDDVEEFLVGRDVYMDMAFVSGYIKEEQFCKILNNHGSHKILFGSDSPWGGQKETIEWLKGLMLSEEEKENILWRNAYKLFS